jgi:hypothetical protein
MGPKSIPWQYARPLLTQLCEEQASESADVRAHIDQTTAYVRD